LAAAPAKVLPSAATSNQPLPERKLLYLKLSATGDLSLDFRHASQREAASHFALLLFELHQAEVGEPESGHVGRLVLGRVGIGPPALPASSLAAANLKGSLKRKTRVGQDPAAVSLGLSLHIFKRQCFVGRFATERELTLVAKGAGDVVAHLLQLDDADRGAPLGFE
jgi:hypothetical protein